MTPTHRAQHYFESAVKAWLWREFGWCEDEEEIVF